MTEHVMLDLETWSIKKTAMIISIGAVKFDPTGYSVIERFHVGIDPEMSPALVEKFDIDPSTIKWWMDPKQDRPRARWLEMEKLDLATALFGFAEWFGNDPDVLVWGNASTFDNVVLRNAYEALYMDCPWGFRSDRCYRTLKNMAQHVPLPVPAENMEGQAHDALFDATLQALHLQDLLRHIEIRP